MEIIVNGKNINVTDQVTVLLLIEENGYNPKRVVVELNGETVPRREWKERFLCEKDIVEVIRLISGG